MFSMLFLETILKLKFIMLVILRELFSAAWILDSWNRTEAWDRYHMTDTITFQSTETLWDSWRCRPHCLTVPLGAPVLDPYWVENPDALRRTTELWTIQPQRGAPAHALSTMTLLCCWQLWKHRHDVVFRVQSSHPYPTWFANSLQEWSTTFFFNQEWSTALAPLTVCQLPPDM